MLPVLRQSFGNAFSVHEVVAYPIDPQWGLAMSVSQTRFRGFKLHYENESATMSMIRAIDDFSAFFSPKDPEPLIIDCGANIGISVLEWKSRWPMSRVICFEPDPDAFRLLEMNIEINDIPRVQCVQAALADFDGSTGLYGDMGRGADARGNSIEPAWGAREGTTLVDVACRRLSPYLEEPVAFLKMDIEGAEERVLRQIAPQLAMVDAMYVEIHETDELSETNSAARIAELLSEAGFTVDSQARFQAHALPDHLDRWRRQTGAKQTQLLCWRDP